MPETPSNSRAYKDLGRALKAFRRHGHWTEQELAEKVGAKDASTISRWEDGIHRPDVVHMNSLLDLNRTLKLFDTEATERFIRLWLTTTGFSDRNTALIVQDRHIKVRERRLRMLASKHERAAKEVEWLRLLADIHRLFQDLPITYPPQTQSARKNVVIDDAIVEALHRIAGCYCDFYKQPNLVTRLSIGTPTAQDPDYLLIKWHKGLDTQTIRVNRCYCGSDDVPPKERGVPGYMFWRARYHNSPGFAVRDVTLHEAFVDRHPQPHRMEYQSVVFVTVKSKDVAEPLGQLAVDSMGYEFTHHDCELLTPIAQEFGWLIHRTQIPYYSGDTNTAT